MTKAKIIAFLMATLLTASCATMRSARVKRHEEPEDLKRRGIYCAGIIGRTALIEGQKVYWVREGDEVEGWKVIRIEEDKVTLYKEEKKKELILRLGVESDQN